MQISSGGRAKLGNLYTHVKEKTRGTSGSHPGAKPGGEGRSKAPGCRIFTRGAHSEVAQTNYVGPHTPS